MESGNEKGGEENMKSEETCKTLEESDAKNNAPQKIMASKEEGSNGNEETYLRADKIDFKSWDVQLDKHFSRAWSRDREVVHSNKEEWEIDSSKLDIRYVIAHGTYGTVYRGTYDGQDVAGITIIFAFFALFQLLL